MRDQVTIAKSATACTVLGLLAYRAGKSYSDRPAEFTHPWQLDAWQSGWSVGFDSEKRCRDAKQSYSLAWVSYHNDIAC